MNGVANIYEILHHVGYGNQAAYCDAWKGPGANKKKEIKISVTEEKQMLGMLLIFL